MTPAEGALVPPYLFAFLRAVNLGKHNKVPMKPLVTVMAAKGLAQAEYLLASGNLVMGQPTTASPELGDAIERLIADEYGVTTTVVFRTAEELKRVVEANPFDTSGAGRVHVSLWNAGTPIAPDGKRELAATDFGNDRLALIGDAAYCYYAGTSHTSRLSNQLIERRLGVRSTARNTTTFERLLGRWPPLEELGS